MFCILDAIFLLKSFSKSREKELLDRRRGAGAQRRTDGVARNSSGRKKAMRFFILRPFLRSLEKRILFFLLALLQRTKQRTKDEEAPAFRAKLNSRHDESAFLVHFARLRSRAAHTAIAFWFCLLAKSLRLPFGSPFD